MADLDIMHLVFTLFESAEAGLSHGRHTQTSQFAQMPALRQGWIADA